MSTPLAIAVFLVGLIVSLGASEVLVTGLSRLGRRIGLAAGLLGLLTALGADGPEISSAITALASGAKDVGIGVILGSNLFNLAALLGLSATIAGQLRCRRILLSLDGGVSLLIMVVTAFLLSRALSPQASVILLTAIFLAYVYVLAVRPRQADRLPLPRRVRHRLALLARMVHPDPGQHEPVAPTWVPVWSIAPATAAIVGGSYAMVTVALTLGSRWQVAPSFLGTVVLAATTSLPNAYAAARLALAGNGPAVLSESFNSNTINLLAGIGLPAAILGGLTVAETAATELWWLFGLTLVALGVGYLQRGLGRLGGLLLIALYLLFLGIQSLRGWG